MGRLIVIYMSFVPISFGIVQLWLMVCMNIANLYSVPCSGKLSNSKWLSIQILPHLSFFSLKKKHTLFSKKLLSFFDVSKYVSNVLSCTLYIPIFQKKKNGPYIKKNWRRMRSWGYKEEKFINNSMCLLSCKNFIFFPCIRWILKLSLSLLKILKYISSIYLSTKLCMKLLKSYKFT